MRGDEPEARAGVRIAAVFGVALGMLYFGADLADARARRDLVVRAVERLPQLGADRARETVWYTGYWEVQFYAERAGMRPVVAGESQLRARDWLLYPLGVPGAPISFPFSDYRQEDELVATSASPWSTIFSYYDGTVPLRRQPEEHAVRSHSSGEARHGAAAPGHGAHATVRLMMGRRQLSMFQWDWGWT